MRPFLFFGSKNFFDISISEDRTGEKEVSTVPLRCPEQYASIFIFQSCFFLSQFLEGVQFKVRFQNYQCDDLKSMRPFEFFGPKKLR